VLWGYRINAADRTRVVLARAKFHLQLRQVFRRYRLSIRLDAALIALRFRLGSNGRDFKMYA
jgi:hypothetical protein